MSNVHHTDRTLVDPVEAVLEHAQRQSAHPAVISETNVATSYAELWAMASRMAAVMATTSEVPRVLVQLPSGASAYAAMLGSLRAGGFYTPVNIYAPLAKQRLIIEQFKPDIIVGTSDLLQETFADIKDAPRFLDIAAIPDQLFTETRPPNKIAYVIFTSGSTGAPKGVVISRAALAHYIAWALTAMAITPADRWSQHPNIGFDLSVLDIYGALSGGATLFPFGRDEGRLMPGPAVRRKELTIWNSVPSVIDVMQQAHQLTSRNLASLRLMTFCGEPLLPEHLEAIFAAHPDVIVHNSYGPTEATVSCTLLRLTRHNYREACASMVAIGEPIKRMNIHLVDGLSPDEGEIVITGPQLAEGYWNNPQATTAAFREIAGADGELTRAYYTGDWAARLNGQTHFSNRIDFQVKINGFRVELGEVNAALRKSGYSGCACILIKDDLHAFLETECPVPEADLRLKLQALLESYAIPKYFHPVQTLPRNANDKIDVKELARSILGQEM